MDFEHDEAAHQYRLRQGDLVVSLADYRVDGSTRTFHHTLTQPEYRDHGHAAELVRLALDDTRASGHSVVATCWYVAGFIDTHPEYKDLLAD